MKINVKMAGDSHSQDQYTKRTWKRLRLSLGRAQEASNHGSKIRTVFKWLGISLVTALVVWLGKKARDSYRKLRPVVTVVQEAAHEVQAHPENAIAKAVEGAIRGFAGLTEEQKTQVIDAVKPYIEQYISSMLREREARQQK